ncbi:IS66 family insertion sequence element accessory protein TnpB [Blautia marasmi]|uniref:IS66 family insertion sequence element accessory protein TnpB n=1 Tax=Blautia marasmi TaxID=1917868 RepID=UPI001A9A35DB
MDFEQIYQAHFRDASPNRCKLDPFSNSLFLFCGRKANRLKALYWEGDGCVLLYKRLENSRFQPRLS